MKEVPNFNGRYIIPKTGMYIYDLHKKRMIFPHMSGVKRRNYPQITLYNNGKKFTKRVHSWMGITYLGMIYGDRIIVVDHKNNDPCDNRLENLQIITMKENSNKDK